MGVVLIGPGGKLGWASVLGRFDSVWSLFAAPGLLAVLGLFGAASLASPWIYARPDELSADAQRALEQHKNAERCLLIGVGLLVVLVQILAMLSAQGFSISIEHGSRAILFVLGVLFANAGNMIPKVPFFSRWWQISRNVYTKVIRFSGSVMAFTGILVCLLALFARLENVRTYLALIVSLMMATLAVYALVQALIANRKDA